MTKKFYRPDLMNLVAFLLAASCMNAYAANHDGYPITPSAISGGNYRGVVKTPVGIWTIQFTQDDCNIHSTCDGSLMLQTSKGKKKMGIISLSIGSTAIFIA